MCGAAAVARDCGVWGRLEVAGLAEGEGGRGVTPKGEGGWEGVSKLRSVWFRVSFLMFGLFS